jgi:hypothetical protein
MDSDDQRRKLCKRFQNSALFNSLPALSWPEPQIAQLKLRAFPRWAMGCGCIAFAVFLLCLPLLPDPDPRFRPQRSSWKASVAPVIAPIVGVVMSGLGIAILLRCERVIFDQRGSTVKLRWGLYSWSREASLPLDSASLRLHQVAGNGPNLGHTALTLDVRRSESIRLATAKFRGQMLPIYEALSSLFGDRKADATFDSETGGTILRTPIAMTIVRHPSRKLTIRGSRAILRGSMTNSMLLMLFAVGLPAFSAFLALTFDRVPDPPWSHALVVGLSAVIAGAAVWEWPRPVILTANDWLKLPRCAHEGTWEGDLHAKDVKAIQICVVQLEAHYVKGVEIPSIPVYQVNLVCWLAPKAEPVRVNLLTDPDWSRTAYSGKQLASLLDVQLLDHC